MRLEHTLIFEISKHYKTKESTENLARVLLSFRGEHALHFVPNKIETTCEYDMVNWQLIAYDVLMEWADRSPRCESLELLDALEKTNPAAVDSFRDILACGKDPWSLLP